ncbi:MAG: xylulokinase, partial [Bacteroidota bacterium]
MGHLLGIDIGSSSIKASLLSAETGKAVAAATSPAGRELEIAAPQPGWAEQRPETWWEHVKDAVARIRAQSGRALDGLEAIGITYQMHGLVLVDAERRPLRPAIIWCDSRAVGIGERAFAALGEEVCLRRFLNSPGNFTASKLRWVMENEPELYRQVYKAMLPGDYVAMRLTGEIRTTSSGLSEGILWDYQDQAPARLVLEHYGIDPALLPDLVPVFGVQGELTREAAAELGLRPGIKVAYRAGDQPNNAFSLNVLEPGELAATAGTSGVVYGVTDKAAYDRRSRVNTFVHVNHEPAAPRHGVLLCVNGTGILNRWLKENAAGGLGYAEMNELAAGAPAGAGGLLVLPYGNGAERTLDNKNPGASLHGLDLNLHTKAHLLRAAQEGVVFALRYGLDIMGGMGIGACVVRAGYANMFLSPLFTSVFASVTG